MQKLGWTVIVALSAALCCQLSKAQPQAKNICPRPQSGSLVEEPEDLRSQNGVLEAYLTARNVAESGGAARYCYSDAAGRESPTLRVNPGDLVILHLKNELRDLSAGKAGTNHAHLGNHAGGSDPCTSAVMSPVSTNLHFHGLTIPPVCHQDDVMKTSIQPEMHLSNIGFAFQRMNHRDSTGITLIYMDSARNSSLAELPARLSSRASNASKKSWRGCLREYS
jgi:FtsP/CotA-like multicopper oxidase with cupredoxin domain